MLLYVKIRLLISLFILKHEWTPQILRATFVELNKITLYLSPHNNFAHIILVDKQLNI